VKSDLRSAIRVLATRPGWTLAAVLCLAIASGANTAAFSLIDTLLLRPLPFDDPGRLVMVALRDGTKTTTRPFALREYHALSDAAANVAVLFARTFFPASLSAADGSQMAQVEVASANYFEALRIKPYAGRFFDATAERAAAETPAVVSDALWRRRFGADPAIVGRSMRINNHPIVIIGIAPANFVGATHLVATDLWVPSILYPALARSSDADATPAFGVMGRLASGVTRDQAQSALTTMVGALPAFRGADPRPTVVVSAATGFGVPIAIQGAVLTLSGFIYLLMALLTVVACANVAALVLARGVSRTREIAVRLSLGASRWDIARQLLVESVVLAVAGCGAGSVVAIWLTHALVVRLSTPFQYVSYAIDVHPDARVLACSLIVTGLAVVLCGIAPVRYASRVDVVDLLARAGSKSPSRELTRTLNATVALQFAVSTVLLATAATLVRTYADSQAAQTSFDPARIVAATIDVDQVGADRAAGSRLFREITNRLAALPGVGGVALTREAPLGAGRSIAIEPVGAGGHSPIAAHEMIVSPGYFRTLDLAVKEGRAFSDADAAQPPLAVVSETLARRLGPAGSNTRPALTFAGNRGAALEVIGVVADAATDPLENSTAVLYRPFPHEYSPRMTALIRVNRDAATVAGEVRRAIHRVNPDLSLVGLRTLADAAAERDAQRRLPAAVFSFVALAGLLLSAVGLYGVVAYAVRGRARELGIRLALGAQPSGVRTLVLRQGLTIAAFGLAIGLVGSAFAARAMRSALFGVRPLDPVTVGAVCLVLVAAASAALYLPARWACRVPPAETLRRE